MYHSNHKSESPLLIVPIYLMFLSLLGGNQPVYFRGPGFHVSALLTCCSRERPMRETAIKSQEGT